MTRKFNGGTSHLEVVAGTQSPMGNVHSLSARRATHLLAEGKALAERGQVDDAIKKFKSSVQAKASAEAYTVWAWTVSILGDLDQAIELCKRAIEIDPSYGNPYNDMGTYFMKKGELDAAVPWLEKAKHAVRYHSKHFPYLNLGRIYLSRCDFPRALTEFDVALTMDPANDELRMVVSRLRARMAYHV